MMGPITMTVTSVSRYAVTPDQRGTQTPLTIVPDVLPNLLNLKLSERYSLTTKNHCLN